MKNVGIYDQSLQQVYLELSKKYDVAFISEEKDADIIISPSLDSYIKLKANKVSKCLKCSVHIINDYLNKLMTVKGITILNRIEDVGYYVENESVERLRVDRVKDNYIYKVLQQYEESVFQRVIQPLIYKGITDKNKKDEIKYVLIKDIFSRLKKDFEPQIKNYEKDIKKKQYENFVKWLLSDDCKKFARQLIAKKTGDLLDGFEVNYLHHVFKNGRF